MDGETLFHEAMSRSPEERAGFLEKTCEGRPELRATLEALIEARGGSNETAEFFQVDSNQTLAREGAGVPGEAA